MKFKKILHAILRMTSALWKFMFECKIDEEKLREIKTEHSKFIYFTPRNL